MGSIVPFKGNQLPDFLIASDGVDNSEFSHGAGEGFGVISYRGKVWRLKHKGEEHKLTRNEEPVSKINVVMVRANKSYSKIYYAKKYAEGDDAAPDCFSADGVKPDGSVERPQCKTCEACPMNAWGSRITDEGKKAKACQDSRRMAVLLVDPTLDITTDEPVLLRIPPASLGELKTYADGMAKAGVPLYKIITQVSFDTDASYPKLMFKAFGWDEGKVDEWTALRDSEVVKRILDASETDLNASKVSTAKPVREEVVDAGEEDDGEDDAPPPKARDAVRAKTSKATELPPSTKPEKTTSKKPAPKTVAPPTDDDDGDGDVTNVDEDDADALVSRLLSGDDD